MRIPDILHRDHSMRGSEVIADGSAMNPHLAHLEWGSSEFFRASLDKNVVSSVLVLRPLSGAYYQLAGTSPEGIVSAAFRVLINGAACQQREEGPKDFDLGEHRRSRHSLGSRSALEPRSCR
jgi:hypothetical protein